MAEPDALDAALALYMDPVSARKMPHMALPPGTATVLAVAIGEEQALAAAQRRSGIGRDVLQQAAGFFIEQALLFHDADSYRVLGARRGATHEELRHNMALLMRWLHPDLQSLRSGPLDREVFTARVSRAWEDLKTDDRRSAYDLRNPPAHTNPAPSRRDARPAGAGPSPGRTPPAARDGIKSGSSRTDGAAKAAAMKAGAMKTDARTGGERAGRPGVAGAGKPGNGRTAAAPGIRKPGTTGSAAKTRRPGAMGGTASPRRPPLSLNRIEGASFWVRLWGFLWRRR